MKYIGIDLSLTSPGLCFNNNDNYKFFFFSSRKKHEKFYYKNDNVEIKSIIQYHDEKSDNIKDRVKNYIYVVKNILEEIDTFMQGSHLNDLRVGIEGYSYGSIGQGFTKLSEIGGILRYEIYKYGINIEEYTPGSIKKYFTGNGNATKNQMYAQFESLKIIDLYDILDLKESKTLNIPHPIEDLVDSFAIIQLMKNEDISHVNMVDKIMDKFDSYI